MPGVPAKDRPRLVEDGALRQHPALPYGPHAPVAVPENPGEDVVELGVAGHVALDGAGALVRPPYVAAVRGTLLVGDEVPDHPEREVVGARNPGGLHGAQGPQEPVLAEVSDVAHVAVLHGRLAAPRARALVVVLADIVRRTPWRVLFLILDRVNEPEAAPLPEELSSRQYVPP